jgi:transcription elongation factor Elf1
MGTFKIQSLDEIRTCTECSESKIVTEFVKGKGNLYRYRCKECKNKSRRTGKISNTRFKPGHTSGVRFEKGHKPWYKIKNVEHPRVKSFARYHSYKYRKWRKAVFEKCDNTCQHCGHKDKLHAHHIVAWNDNEMLRFDVDNGIILCISCHAKEEGLGIKIKPNIIRHSLGGSYSY